MKLLRSISAEKNRKNKSRPGKRGWHNQLGHPATISKNIAKWRKINLQHLYPWKSSGSTVDRERYIDMKIPGKLCEGDSLWFASKSQDLKKHFHANNNTNDHNFIKSGRPWFPSWKDESVWCSLVLPIEYEQHWPSQLFMSLRVVLAPSIITQNIYNLDKTRISYFFFLKLQH
jgi:hypothetical protein